MIKTFKTIHECLLCGNLIPTKRDVVIDNYLKEIKISFPRSCLCKAKKKDMRLVDIEIID